jgi:peptidoglycan/LPS O-acetylase OafA/YrhL
LERRSTAVAAGPPEENLRTDIQALRAIAVASVVTYHLWPGRVSGGYVGVDVFFVISGFLITGHLFREAAAGRLRPLTFWARRAKRLVPASALVLGSVVVATMTVVPESLRIGYLHEVIAAAGQYENWKLGHDAVDYFAANNATSPTQHFWSLSVEEQFYVGLPLLLLLGIFLAKGLRVPVRLVTGLLLVLISVASLAYSIHLTAAAHGVAYMSTFTRVWEFGIGAGLAITATLSRRTALAETAASAGVVGIAAAVLFYSDASPFPGWIALLPTVGTGLVIWAGRGSWVTWLGALDPVAWLGRISYSVYLWHFPLIIIVPVTTQHPLTRWESLVVLAATLLLAWGSTNLVEDPMRFHPRLLGGRRPAIVLGLAAGATAVLVGSTLLLIHGTSADQENQREADIAIAAHPPRCFGAASMDPALRPCINPALGRTIIPKPANAAADDPDRQECIGMYGPDSDVRMCHLGVPDGRRRILAVGDSHMLNLIGVLDDIGRERGWSIDLSGLGGCYLTTATPARPSDDLQKGCDTWRHAMLERARTGPYDGYFVTHWSVDPVRGDGRSRRETVRAGLVDAWRLLPQDKPIVALVDNPTARGTTNTCVETAGSPARANERCSIPRAEAFAAYDGNVDAARSVPNARVLDLTHFYCTRTACPPVIGGVLVWRDGSHLTGTFENTLRPYLSRELAALFRLPPG